MSVRRAIRCLNLEDRVPVYAKTNTKVLLFLLITGTCAARAGLTLEGHDDEDGGDANEAGPADVRVQQVGDDECERGVDPQVVQEDGHDVEPTDVVAEQVHHLAGGGLAERGLAQPGGLENSDS